MGHGNGVLYFLVISCLIDFISSQCADCSDYGYCLETAEDGTCAECICPTGFSGDCCETDAPSTACSSNPCGSDSDQHFQCDNLAHGLYICSCKAGWTGSDCDQAIDPCDPNPCQNSGTCSVNNSTFSCSCDSSYTGQICESLISCIDDPNGYGCDCSSEPCSNNATCIENTGNVYTCQCSSQNFTGDNCENEPCNPSPCLHGGHCYTNSDGSTTCLCPSIWAGSYCDNFNVCMSSTACQNGGTCISSDDGSSKTCNCVEGWEGDSCETMTDNCDPNPCKEDGVCTNMLNDFSCDCIFGLEGKDCSENPDNCDLGGGKTPCNSMSNDNQCVDGYGTYTCSCSPDYTGANCTMSMDVYIILVNNGSVSVLDLLQDAVDSPTLIKDIMPFYIGQLSTENQSLLSWDAEDIFIWAAYENTELDISTDLYKWFDMTLGSCFTFNHRNSPKSYTLRRTGENNGFKALMRVRQDEYVSWIDVASLLIYVHPSSESVFSESVGYQVAPRTSAQIISSKVSYQRLNGKYGDCANSVDEVNSYYYEGSYTTAGCLRSCYQDAVKEACQCMDPRYSIPEGETACNIEMWNCVHNVTDMKGDASNWPECRCSAPCNESQFVSSYGVTAFVSEPLECNPSSEKYNSCMENFADMAMVTVMVPRLSQRIFIEYPKMTFNQFISYIGGLAGIFIGFSIMTIVDVGILLLLLARACMLKDNGESVYGRN